MRYEEGAVGVFSDQAGQAVALTLTLILPGCRGEVNISQIPLQTFPSRHLMDGQVSRSAPQKTPSLYLHHDLHRLEAQEQCHTEKYLPKCYKPHLTTRSRRPLCIWIWKRSVKPNY